MPLNSDTVGLGYRRSMYQELIQCDQFPFDFLEIAPENWMNSGPRLQHQLRALRERVPFTTHGLSLSIGGFAPRPIRQATVERVQKTP